VNRCDDPHTSTTLRNHEQGEKKSLHNAPIEIEFVLDVKNMWGNP
jgi:hypothetical protein